MSQIYQKLKSIFHLQKFLSLKIVIDSNNAKIKFINGAGAGHGGLDIYSPDSDNLVNQIIGANQGDLFFNNRNHSA